VTEGKVSGNQLARFGLGTAQFGMYYGRYNREGVPSRVSASAILEKAVELGLSCIDTAHSYGEAEAVFGHCSSALGAFSIVTKTPRFPDEGIRADDAQMLRAAFESSLRLMGQSAIDGLLIHHAPNLLADGGDLLYREMACLKEAGLVKRIGVSAYSGDIVEQIHEKFPLDFAQLPINLLDRRLVESGSLSRITRSGIKVHARSAFLQGLLLAEPNSLPLRFEAAKEVLKAFQAACQSAGVTPAQAALHYLQGIPEIEKIIVGVESLTQLTSIFSNFPEETEMCYDELKLNILRIIDPVSWDQ
jgi:aryl-alcohol dehydrogenase-like predicted oxidoreductase